MCERVLPLVFTVSVSSLGAQLIAAEVASDCDLLPSVLSFVLFLVIFPWKIKGGA